MSNLKYAVMQSLAFTMRDFATARDFEAARAKLRDSLHAALVSDTGETTMQLTVTARNDDFVAVRFTGGNTAQAVGLIAAAPDLLAALQWALAQIEDSLDPDHQAALESAHACVRRATGGQ